MTHLSNLAFQPLNPQIIDLWLRSIGLCPLPLPNSVVPPQPLGAHITSLIQRHRYTHPSGIIPQPFCTTSIQQTEIRAFRDLPTTPNSFSCSSMQILPINKRLHHRLILRNKCSQLQLHLRKVSSNQRPPLGRLNALPKLLIPGNLLQIWRHTCHTACVRTNLHIAGAYKPITLHFF